MQNALSGHRETSRPPRVVVVVAVAAFALGALAGCTPPSARRAQVALSRGDYAEARRAIEGGLQKSPDSGDLRALELRLLIANEKRGEAVARYRQRPSSSLRFAFAESMIWYALRHRDPAIRLRAVHAVRGADATTLLRDIAARLDDPDGVVRSWAAVALSTQARGAETLQKQLHVSDARARAVAVGELGRIARGAALATIARYATDRSARVRAAAARSLGDTREGEAVPTIVKLLSDRDADVRLAAARALGGLGSLAARAAPSLRAALSDKALPVRLAAASAIAHVDKKAARDALGPVARGRGDKPDAVLLQLRAGLALARLGERQPVLDAIARALVHAKASVRIAALTSAAALGDDVARDLARRALRDAQPRARLAAARAVLPRDKHAALDVARSVESLACDSKAKGMAALCVQAATLLARGGDARGAARLSKLVTSAPDANLRTAALRWALLRTTKDEATKLAVTALGDASLYVALDAAEWLYRHEK